MLRRCYDEKYHQKEPTYIGCTVCDEWRYFLNFEKWYEDNWYDIEGETMCLDKDILVKGNNLYINGYLHSYKKDTRLIFSIFY